jgi:hypothetical protein
MKSHKIMVPPDVYGEVVKVYHGSSDGYNEYNLNEKLITVHSLLVYREWLVIGVTCAGQAR